MKIHYRADLIIILSFYLCLYVRNDRWIGHFNKKRTYENNCIIIEMLSSSERQDFLTQTAKINYPTNLEYNKAYKDLYYLSL